MFCDNLRAARKKAGFSQREIAEKLFVSAQAVGKWERGDATPGPDAIMQLASILNVSADELLDVQIKRGLPSFTLTRPKRRMILFVRFRKTGRLRLCGIWSI